MKSSQAIFAGEGAEPLVRLFGGLHNGINPLSDPEGYSAMEYTTEDLVNDTVKDTPKKKPKKATLLTPASGRGLSGGDMSIKHKNLLGE